MRSIIVLITVLLLTGCLGMPKTITPVKNFNVERYLGKWYEVARLDHSFERGLELVTAEYSMRDDGGIAVINTGYSAEKGEWQVAEGKAYFVDSIDEGYLKVSFFGPFYGSYVVFELDNDEYQYSMVSGPDTSYLWLLSRTPVISPSMIDKFKRIAQERGFDSSELIFVNH